MGANSLDSRTHVFCKMSFKVTCYIDNIVDENSYLFMIENVENDIHFNVYKLCKWLSDRHIKFDLCFKYCKDKSFLWNWYKLKNYYRLKYRLNHPD